MVKDMKQIKPKVSEEDQLTQNWLNMPPSRAEKRRMDYWFDRLKTEMYDDLHRPGNIKSRWSLLLRRMEMDFPQYEKLQNGDSYETTVLYKAIWRHFQRLVAKWQKDSPKKFRRSPRALSQMSTEDSVKNSEMTKMVTNGNKRSQMVKNGKNNYKVPKTVLFAE